MRGQNGYGHVLVIANAADVFGYRFIYRCQEIRRLNIRIPRNRDIDCGLHHHHDESRRDPVAGHVADHHPVQPTAFMMS